MDLDSPSLSVPLDRLNGRILLVEDDHDHQPLLLLMLRKAGAEVTLAENGQVALDLTRTARDARVPFELIVMDLQMPVLDGLAATQELRAQGFRSPIIALTARASSADRDRSLAAGCDAFVSKPVVRTDFLRLLASHLSHSRAAHRTDQK
jgi:CheY-like chemotaxis protein